VADFYGKLPCKNPLWLGTRPDMLQRAVAHDLASTWFSAPTVADDTFIAQLKDGSERAVYASLPMIHKSGGCVLGLESVMQALEEDALKCVLIATDAGKSDQKKLINNPEYAPFCTAFGTRAQLGAAFGRRAQVFIGIRHGLLAKKLAFFLRCHMAFSDD
jgi:ribosomal protein L30E